MKRRMDLKRRQRRAAAELVANHELVIPAGKPPRAKPRKARK